MRYAALDPGAYVVAAHPRRIRAGSFFLPVVAAALIVMSAIDVVRGLVSSTMTGGEAGAFFFAAAGCAIIVWGQTSVVLARLRGSIGVAVDAPGVTLDSRQLRKRTGSGLVRWQDISRVRLYTLMSRDTGESPATTIFRPVVHLDLSDGTQARWIGRDASEIYDREQLTTAVRRFAPTVPIHDAGVLDDDYEDPARAPFDLVESIHRMTDRARARRGLPPIPRRDDQRGTTDRPPGSLPG